MKFHDKPKFITLLSHFADDKVNYPLFCNVVKYLAVSHIARAIAVNPINST